MVYIGQQQYTFVKVQIAFEPEDHDSVGIYHYIRVQFLERRKGKDRDMLFTCVIWVNGSLLNAYQADFCC